MGPTAAGYHDTGGSATLHFPDGNASIANVSSQIVAGIDEVMSKRTFKQRPEKADTVR